VFFEPLWLTRRIKSTVCLSTILYLFLFSWWLDLVIAYYYFFWLLHTITYFESIVPIYWCLDDVFRATQWYWQAKTQFLPTYASSQGTFIGKWYLYTTRRIVSRDEKNATGSGDIFNLKLYNIFYCVEVPFCLASALIFVSFSAITWSSPCI
jgi:hypothetical protein